VFVTAVKVIRVTTIVGSVSRVLDLVEKVRLLYSIYASLLCLVRSGGVE